MRAAGIVIEITDTALKIERKVKDKVETMEFTLEKPLVKIKAGDKVRVSYITREDLNVATRVEADVPQTAIKKAKNPEVKTAPAVTAPAGK
jgi:autonomous glycyl radical cofactor GrcA